MLLSLFTIHATMLALQIPGSTCNLREVGGEVLDDVLELVLKVLAESALFRNLVQEILLV